MEVQLDVRDLGGHLDFTLRAWAGRLSNRVREATFGVSSIGALPLGFGVKLGLVRGKYLPAGFHAAEASYVSYSSNFVLFGLLLFVQYGPLRCLLLVPLPFLIFSMVL